jgi:hypothetical protein
MIYPICVFALTGLFCCGTSAEPLHQDSGPDGIVSVEAENFDNKEPGQDGSEWELVGPTEGFTGEAGMQVTGGGSNDTDYSILSPRLDYEVYFSKTGTHYVWVRAWGAGGGDDSCHAGLDGAEIPTCDRMSGWNANYTWSNSTMDPEDSTFEVTSTGLHTVNIWMREDGLIVDKIVITTNPDFSPAATDAGPAESYRGPILNAYDPKPAEGEAYPDTWANLSWTAGATAASHEVYFSENFDDVNDGAAGAFLGSQSSAFTVVGLPGFGYPDGLVPGTRYYWRVDEIEADGSTTHKGPIWSFTIPPKTAYEPVPADGEPFIDLNPTLSWTAGFDTKLHYVYFGDNFEDVNSGQAGIAVGINNYSPGTLEAGTVYYWRVDEFDSINTYKGEVWSFKTAKADGGVRGEYYKGTDFENLVLSRTDAQIAFIWGEAGSPDELVGEDKFSVRWSGEVEAPFSETYTFYTNTDDGVRLWVDGQLLVDDWNDQSVTENYGTIELVGGNVYPVVMEYYENEGGATAELRWESASTPKQLVPQAALSRPVRAGSYSPADEAADVPMEPVLKWKAGDFASSHDVYFGTDADAVQNADTASPEYKGSTGLGAESFAPGALLTDSTYYWRIDEVNNANPDSPWKGNVLSFTTGDYLIVDDFESYNDLDPEEAESNRIYLTWLDGFDNPTTNGSIVGYENAPFAEQDIVRNGSQSMPYFYDNNMKYSEARRTFTPAQDWTRLGVTTLSLSFLGDAGNSIEPMYVKINGKKLSYNGDAADITRPRWQFWNIELSSVGVNPQNVTSLAIGFGDETNPTAGGSGVVYFDDIRVHQTAPQITAASEEIWLEAEDADTITAPLELYTDVAKASGGECIGTTDDVGNSSGEPPYPDGTATYNFTITEGGTYKISCRVIIPDGDSFWLRVAGAATQTANHSSGWIRWSDPEDSDVWYWADVFSAEDGGETVLFTMEPGGYTLEVGYREDAALMDTILISKVE